MSFTELLRNSRSGRVAILHKFLTNYDPAAARVYAFVEGLPDQSFYRPHIEKHLSNQRDLFIYNCEGKGKAYEVYAHIIARYPTCDRVLFFVDKDVDDIIGHSWPSDPRIFTTEYYSIENYVVSQDSLKRYLADFVKLRRVDVNLVPVLAQFEADLAAFHSYILPIMSWVVIMRRAGHRVVLNDMDIGSLVVVADSGVRRRPHRQAVAYLKRVTQTNASGPVWRQVRATCRELRRLHPKVYVRGKFEAWCFVQLVRRILEGMSSVAREAGGSISITAPLSEGTLIQLLAAASATPPSLDAFLKFHLARGATGADAQPPVLPRSLPARLFSWLRSR